MSEIDVNKVLAKHAKTLGVVAESVKERTLGKHVAAIIEAHGEVSVALLKALLEQAISQSASAKGEKSPEHDLTRLADEAALNYLNDLLAKPRAG